MSQGANLRFSCLLWEGRAQYFTHLSLKNPTLAHMSPCASRMSCRSCKEAARQFANIGPPQSPTPLFATNQGARLSVTRDNSSVLTPEALARHALWPHLLLLGLA